MPDNLAGKYILVSAHHKNEPDRLENPVGPFPSAKAAEKYARNDAEDTFCMDMDERGRIEDWGSPMYLCQIVRVFKPVPVVSVKIELSKIEEI